MSIPYHIKSIIDDYNTKFSDSNYNSMINNGKDMDIYARTKKDDWKNACQWHKFGLTKMIQRYLDLQLLDISIKMNGVSLFDLCINENRDDMLKCLLKSQQCDWSMFKNKNNQAK